MIIGYILAFIIFLVVNGVIYISGLKCLWIGLKEFPRRKYLLLWPILLLLANIYFGVIQTAQHKVTYKKAKAGVIYHTQDSPTHIAFKSYTSTQNNLCDQLCLELLFEEQVDYVTVTWDNLQSGSRHQIKHVTFEAWAGNCFEFPENLSSANLIHAFYGYCIRPVKAPTAPTVEIVLAQNLNYFYESVLGGRKRNYRHGVAIFDSSNTEEKLMAIHAKYTPEIITLPLLLKCFNSDGMEGAIQVDKSFVTRRLKEEEKNSQPAAGLSYKEERAQAKAKYEKIADRNYALINETLNFHVDGTINFPNYVKPSEEAAARMIEKVFKNGNRAHIDIASKFANSYEGFPFLNLMKGLATGEKTRAAYQAQSYIDRWLRIHNPQVYKQNMLDRRKRSEDEKAERAFNNAKRFCELESRRDGRDCSKYQTPQSNK